MDIEIGSHSHEPYSESTVFTDVCSRISDVPWYSRRIGRSSEFKILDGVCGALRPGRLTFIIGPSGAGKTTVMKILAGRKKTGVTGCVQGAGRNAVLVPQHATLIDALTVKETLDFAASLKLPNVSRRERSHTVDAVSRQLGIYDAYNTKTGRLSGGERKRLTIATELLTDPPVLLLDEPTSGLDSVSSMSVIKALQTVARAGKTVACVIHQPSSQLFTSADDVILLANGRTLYCGAIADIPQVLNMAGLACPLYYNMADYLLEVATGEHNGNLARLEHEAKTYAMEMKKIAQQDILLKNGKDSSTEAEALLNSNNSFDKTFSANWWQQMAALLKRGFLGALRDVHLSQIRVVTHFIVALLLGALYNGAGDNAGRMLSNSGCLFFFLLFLYFSNAMPTIHTFPVESTVVLQEHLNKWYYLSTYCASKIIVDLPVQLLCATIFVVPAWYFTSQPMDPFRIGLAWSICALLTILAQTFGLVVGAACGVKLGLFVIPAANIPMLMFSEFFIPYQEMPKYLRPFANISYFRYAFDAFLETAYGFDRPKLKCYKEYCIFRRPTDFLKHLGLSRNITHDVTALVIWIVILQISLLGVLRYKVYRACR